MRSVVVLKDAAEDIEQTRAFYDWQAQGIGDYFADSILSDIESLALFYGIHAMHLVYYRMLASRFPFGIYYTETTTEARVFAVLDLRRDPLWIRKELTGR